MNLWPPEEQFPNLVDRAKNSIIWGTEVTLNSRNTELCKQKERAGHNKREMTKEKRKTGK